MSTEGFREPEAVGVHGQICVTDSGNSPTENLSIVNTVQAYSGSTTRSFSSTVDLSQNPIIAPGDTYCYPFELTIKADSEQEALFQMTTAITITNHTSMVDDRKYCPGTKPCPYGPEITSDISLPAP
jgi:hypothetical protein